MRTALIAPTNLLEVVQPFSDYHLALTHKVAYERKYSSYYASRISQGDYVLLDNSAAEKNGRSLPLDKVVLASVLIRPQVVFLPDVLFELDKTLDAIEEAIMALPLRFLRRVHPQIKLAAVVQGLTKEEWLDGFEILNRVKGIDILGIPMLTAHIFGSRVNVLEKIARKVTKQCHLLGAWHDCTLDEIRRESTFPFVMGIDTTKPVKLAIQGKSLQQWGNYERNKGFIDMNHTNVDLELVRRNCRDFVEVCNGR